MLLTISAPTSPRLLSLTLTYCKASCHKLTEKASEDQPIIETTRTSGEAACHEPQNHNHELERRKESYEDC